LKAQNFRHIDSWRQSGLLALAEEALATGAVCHREVHMTTTFNKEIWVHAHFTPFTFGDDPHLLAIFEDITERKRGDESLKLFRMLVDQSNDMVQVVDLETMRLLDVNLRVCSSLGYTREELLSMSVRDIDPTIDEIVRAKLDGELRTSGFAIFEGLQRRKDGSMFPVEVSLRYAHLDRSYVVCAIRDISERVQAQEALREAEEKYRRIFEEAVIGIYQTTPEGRLLSANPALARLYGYDSPAEMMAGLTDIAHQTYVDPRMRELFKSEVE